MSRINTIFSQIENLVHTEGQCEFSALLKDIALNKEQFIPQETFVLLKTFLHKLFSAIDELANEIKKDETILISVRNQKLLRTCFQLITSVGILQCLIPGLGIHLTKRCISGAILPKLNLTDEQKYEMLVDCTEFFIRSYSIPVLKTIIITLHLSDYLAALIQLSFAPFKKPGSYNHFTMTQEMYDKLTLDRDKYVNVYNNLVSNCFQPIIMKELLVLQGTNPPLPNFAKRAISKELSQRLLAQGGLLSLIRCFIESYNIDTGFEWKKIDMICRIVASRHGNIPESEYIANICAQLKEILSLNNTHYLATAVACVLNLSEKYPQNESVGLLLREVFQAFDYDCLITNSNLPGTIIMTPKEVEQKVNVLHACVCTTKLDWPVSLLIPNLFLLFSIGTKCIKPDDLKTKLKDILVKSLEKLEKEELYEVVKAFLFGKSNCNTPGILIEEYDAGIVVKSVANCIEYSQDEAVVYFVNLFKSATDNNLISNIFEVALKILININIKRQTQCSKDMLLSEDDPMLINEIDQNYAIILQLLSEISSSPKTISCLKANPLIIFEFIKYFILKQNHDTNDECITIALVLLNTILTNSDKLKDFDDQLKKLIPQLKKISANETNLNNIICKEILSVINADASQKKESACERAISDVFDELLPVRAHGIIELAKLIDAKDAETISKKHYIFCIFQDQLKDSDSYIYLSAINGLASLCTHCTEDVLHVLCKEFLQVSSEQDTVETTEQQNKLSELRMKTGDVIVKVTKRLGEMAVCHKTVLLNTMLYGCRDQDPLIRTSALSNLAEICLVLHYKIGSIIYEVLLCIWSIIETDKAIECRRAAVMVISSLIKGLGKETLIQLKENLLPIYRTLKSLYRDNNEDATVRLHAQLALEELNDVVNQFLFPELKFEKQIFLLDEPENRFK